jgi:hypothetical protein
VSFLCFDRVPDDTLQDSLNRQAGTAEAGGLTAHFWPPGSTLRVRFLDGSPELHQEVMKAAASWVEGAALSFTVVQSGDAEIRVTFAGPGNWSALGTMSRTTEFFPADEPSMCLGEVPGAAPERIARLARHEFGHAIGLIHEHSTPAAGIRWNVPVVLAALGGAPNFWSREQVAHNVFAVYGEDQSQYTQFDEKSVMLYAFPSSWTLDGMTFPHNVQLSATDRAFIQTVYPL